MILEEIGNEDDPETPCTENLLLLAPFDSELAFVIEALAAMGEG